jgi:hypothetical protein
MRGTGSMDKLSAAEFEAAKARGNARMRGPRAETAHYDAGRNRVVVKLTTGIEIAFAPRDVEGLQHASTDDLRSIEIEAFGLGIRFPGLDADLYVPALLKGVLGSKKWMAARHAKSGVLRADGKRGNQPRKHVIKRAGKGARER